MPAVHPDRTPAAAARLTKALGVLKHSKGDATQGATISQLCRLVGVSRNAVYRYHPKILAELREQQGRDYRPSGKWASSSVGTDHAVLQFQISKLTALVDHYYAAYRESRALLDRRDRQLAELRRKLNNAPVLVRPR
ncbi:MAG TPA: helix-turn-helix domain-containing protein [Xanthobacteraceae bacterium]|jgi:AcrR family transcriptional regulator